MTKPMTNNTRNTTKQILAMVAAVPAITPNPKTPAINAMTKKVSAQLNMTVSKG